MSENLTLLFAKAQDGDRAAEGIFYRLVFSRLRHIAAALLRRERRGHTLQPTALVSEMFLKMRGLGILILNEDHFFQLSARVMTHVLIDHGRVRRAKKRITSDAVHEQLVSSFQTNSNAEMRIAVETVLRKLQAIDPIAATTIWRRYVEGMTLQELSQLQGRPMWKVRADCEFGLQWMAEELGRGAEDNKAPIPSAQAMTSAGRSLGVG